MLGTRDHAGIALAAKVDSAQWGRGHQRLPQGPHQHQPGIRRQQTGSRHRRGPLLGRVPARGIQPAQTGSLATRAPTRTHRPDDGPGDAAHDRSPTGLPGPP